MNKVLQGAALYYSVFFRSWADLLCVKGENINWVENLFISPVQLTVWWVPPLFILTLLLSVINLMQLEILHEMKDGLWFQWGCSGLN